MLNEHAHDDDVHKALFLRLGQQRLAQPGDNLGCIHGNQHSDEGALHNVSLAVKGPLEGPLAHVLYNNGRGPHHPSATRLGLPCQGCCQLDSITCAVARHRVDEGEGSTSQTGATPVQA